MNSEAKKVDQSQIVEIPSKELASVASAMQLQSGVRASGARQKSRAVLSKRFSWVMMRGVAEKRAEISDLSR